MRFKNTHFVLLLTGLISLPSLAQSSTVNSLAAETDALKAQVNQLKHEVSMLQHHMNQTSTSSTKVKLKSSAPKKNRTPNPMSRL